MVFSLCLAQLIPKCWPGPQYITCLYQEDLVQEIRGKTLKQVRQLPNLLRQACETAN